MKKISEEIIRFFQRQRFVIVTTIDKRGYPHSSCKDIVKISERGEIYLLDVYLKNTYRNLLNNPKISIIAVDEYKFKGYCLKGSAVILKEKELVSQDIISAWEQKVASRVTQRVIRNIREDKGLLKHPEILFPKPKYMIKITVSSIIDLAPKH